MLNAVPYPSRYLGYVVGWEGYKFPLFYVGHSLSASNIKGVSGRGVSPGEVLVVVLVVLVVAF